MKSPWSPSCSQQRPAAEFLYATKAQHRDKAQHHRWGPWILATDGGIDIPTSAGIGILLSSPRSSEIIQKVSTNGGTRPCSRTTESRALLPAMERLSVHRIQHRRKTLLVVTDSHSLLDAVTKGPLSHTEWTEDRIRQRLLSLTRAGWSVQLHFATDIAEYTLTSLQISMRRRPRQPGNTRSME
ncbi:putative RNase H [Trypanosoma cruzi]|uniref:Putative RNase H n=1 Tax=Trypanosoma cruzi TaxID=5693 RepID=A0A2V2XJN7_TRYCR|nr:putative RNase H [Trypanosoma cruzi]RNC39859.1 RNaseH [Trypanosoma cruzi]